MEASIANHNLALLIDHENVHSSQITIETMLRKLSSRGRIIIKRAYGDWSRFSSSKIELLRNGIDLIELPSVPRGKNRADIRLVVDAMEIVFTKSFVDTFVLMSGDSDFIQLASKLRELNRRVIFIAQEESASSLLRESADEVIYVHSFQDASARMPSSKQQEITNKPAAKSSKLERTLLSHLAWCFRLLIATDYELADVAQVAQAMQRLYPNTKLTAYGFPKSGCWSKLSQALEQDGFCELEYDESRRVMKIRATESLIRLSAETPEPPVLSKIMRERESRADLVKQTAARQAAAKQEAARSAARESAKLNQLQMILPFNESGQG
jgi:uncharacterized protein (TIGR00288 family)